MPSSALIIPHPVNALPNKLAANVSNGIGKNPPFCFFHSFLIVLLIPFMSNPDSSRDLTILIVSSISSFEIINAVITDL